MTDSNSSDFVLAAKRTADETQNRLLVSLEEGHYETIKIIKGEAFYSDSQGMSLQRRPTYTLKKGNFWSEKVPSFQAWLFHLRRNKRK